MPLTSVAGPYASAVVLCDTANFVMIQYRGNAAILQTLIRLVHQMAYAVENTVS